MFGTSRQLDLIDAVPACVHELRNSGIGRSLEASLKDLRDLRLDRTKLAEWCVDYWLEFNPNRDSQFRRDWIKLVESEANSESLSDRLVSLRHSALQSKSYGFRKGPVVVDGEGPYGFISAACSIGGRLVEIERLLSAVESPFLKPVVCAVGLAFLHPFPDGNGRTIRLHLATFGEWGVSRWFALSFARRMKSQGSKEFAEALAFLRFGDCGFLAQFCDRAADDLRNLIDSRPH